MKPLLVLLSSLFCLAACSDDAAPSKGPRVPDAGADTTTPPRDGDTPNTPDATVASDARVPDPDVTRPPDSGDPTPRALVLPDDYIRSEQASHLVFELDAVAGIAPRAAAKAYVVDRLGAVADKPGGITWTTDGTIPSRGADHVWTFEELKVLARETYDLAVPATTAKIHVLYLDGSYETNSVLGVAWSNRHLVIFSKVLERACSQVLLSAQMCPAAESSVLLHEVGHVIGLVDAGVEMVTNHKDPDHGAHDSSDSCVMYWAYDGVGVLDVLAGRLTGASPELDFDAACRADLAALRNR